MRTKAALWGAVAGVVLLTGCDGFMVPAGEGEQPTPAPTATRAAPGPSGIEVEPGPRPQATPAGPPSAAYTPPVCPYGVRAETGPINAAMGARATTITLTNCGSKPYTAHGHPSIQILDKDRKPFALTVRLRPSSRQSITLQPGESTTASLSWRMNNGSGMFLKIEPNPRHDSMTVPLDSADVSDGDTIELGMWGERPES
ncbi:DUF4232 domain-containing protein [Streptomyces sp. NPDC021093]|uniref:DUF4232 domain-containing protein n=1 Tax=Streptomyces sp. NPDC021093 TaxID=3365112 RepID=UPI00379051A3